MPEPTSSPDRQLRAIADTVGGMRARTTDDATDPAVPVAATVVIVREAAAGPEVLMIERPDRGSFAGAWVFPGGKVDDADRAASRGHAADDSAASEEADARRAAVRETHEETGLAVGGRDLVTLSCWDPPPGIAMRFRTWFFVVPAPADVALSLSEDEAVAAQWIRPGDALERHARGELPLYPPTWVTLDSLAGQPDARALLEIVRMRGVERFETVAHRGPDGPMLLWAGDAEYTVDGAASASGRHRLEIGSLPWRYTRAG